MESGARCEKEEAHMSHANLGDPNLRTTFQQLLSDVSFPASREEIASSAERNNAPHAVVEWIRTASAERFNSLDEVRLYPTSKYAYSEERFPGDWTGGGPDDL
jgi:hypothetical protein